MNPTSQNPIDYAGPAHQPRRWRPGKRSLWFVLLAAVLVFAFLRWNQTRDHYAHYRFFGLNQDMHGSGLIVDTDIDGICLVTSNSPGWGYSSSYYQGHGFVAVGDPEKSTEILIPKHCLAVYLPDGTHAEFPLPKGFAAVYDNWRSTRAVSGDYSLMREVISQYPQGPNHDRLVAFLAWHTEPSTPSRTATTSVTTRP